MNKTLYKIIFFIFCLLICSCKQEFDNVSAKKKYSHLINSKYVTLQNLQLHGMATYDNYGENIGRYVVTKPPGIGGPEVALARRLDSGAIFKVEKVLRCNNCFLSSPVVIVIDLLSEKLQADVPIMLYGLRIKGEDDYVELDPSYVSRVSRDQTRESMGSDSNGTYLSISI